MTTQNGMFGSFLQRANKYTSETTRRLRRVYQPQAASTPLVEHLVAEEDKQALARRRSSAALDQVQDTLATVYEQTSEAVSETVQLTYERFKTRPAYALDHRTSQWLHPAKTAPKTKRSSFGLTEEEVNVNLALSLSALGLDILGWLLFPPLRLLALPLIAVSSVAMFKVAWFQLRHQRTFGVAGLVCFTLVVLIATGNFGLSVLTGLVNSLAFKLQFRVQDNSKKQLVDVFKQQPHFVWVLMDGQEVRIPFSRLLRGAIVVVHSGEMIPVDGAIIEGSASIDQHLLTGESQPAEKSVGDPVFAATMVLAGSIQIEAEKAGAETTVAQIGAILNNTISARTEMQSRAEDMANRTVIPTLGLALVTIPFLGPVPAAALIAAHFGMRMSIVAPLVILNYFRIMANQNILVKDGRTLDSLRDVDTVVFDKTGTLTIHQPHVGAVYAWEGASESDVLAWAAAAEYKQSHPIALAIVDAARRREVAIPAISDAAYEVGYGLSVWIDTAHIHVGSQRFMQKMDIPLSAEVEAAEEAAHQQGHSLVLVARNSCVVGAIELVPTVRPETPRVVAALRARGIKHIAIISGDREAPTRKLAHDLGMDEYFAETLPQHKAEIIDQLQQQGRSVCYVGDGINDAIALKKAHVSVSMSGASTIATDTAQIVLLDKGIEHLQQLFDFADEFDHTMKACFGLVLSPSILAMGGVWFLGFGLAPAVLFKQISLIMGAAGAMVPLVQEYLPQTKTTLELPAGDENAIVAGDENADQEAPVVG